MVEGEQGAFWKILAHFSHSEPINLLTKPLKSVLSERLNKFPMFYCKLSSV